jgi:F420-non-reducing hydrogenase iron-sulfur subunit
MRLIRVMCTGRVDPAFILRAFSNGADGVYIGGCWPGECHYVTEGNYHALSNVLLMKKVLAHIGVNPERLRIEWVGASEGVRFAEIMNDVSKKIKELGPLGAAEGIDSKKLAFKLEAVDNIIPFMRLVERERMRMHFKKEEEYREFYASEELNRLFKELVADKLAVSEIMLLLRKGPLSSGEISESLGLERSDVVRYLNSSVRQGLIRFDESQKVSLPPTVNEHVRV